MVMAVLEEDVLDTQEGYVGAEFDRGVTRLVDRTVAELSEDRSLDPLGALVGVVGIMTRRPELVRRLGTMTDGRLERQREASRRRYHADKERLNAERTEARRRPKEIERAELEELMTAA